MDDIDRAKIGRKEEKLVGWTNIRKHAETNLPPMKVKATTNKKIPRYLIQKKHGFPLGFFIFLIICFLVLTKYFGVW